MKQIHIATYQDAAKPLAKVLPEYSRSVVIRLGGNHAYDDYEVQINSAEAINNSINKLSQKNLLIKGKIKTLSILSEDKISYPCVVKGVVRSCGTKVIVVNTQKEFNAATAKLYGCNGYIIEPLFEATSEYRLHCTRDEVFFAVKKMRREGHENDIVINHKNHYNVREFLKPRLWKEIQEECLRAMKVLNLDIACFDIMYSSKNNLKHEFNIAEANTNPELLKNTFDAYTKALDKLIREKIGALPDLFAQIKQKSLAELLKVIKALPENIQKQFL